MKSRIAMHVGAAALVVGLAVSSALAIEGSVIENSGARLNVTQARKFTFDYSLKEKGGGGGKLRCEFDGQSGYFAEGTNLEGVVFVPVNGSHVQGDVFLFVPAGKGSRNKQKSSTTKLNSAKDGESNAGIAIGQFGEFMSWVNLVARGEIMEPMPMKKAKPYVPLEDGFVFTSGKFLSKAKVFSDGSKYNGILKATLKGESVSGKKVTGKLKVVYKSAERAF